MGGTYGLNVLAQFVQDRQALLNWVDAAKPGAMVVMDDYGLAQAVRVVSPSTTVIHRSYHPQDHEFHHHLTPEQFASAYLNNVPPGIVVQVLNEPFGYTDLRPLATWVIRVMELAAERNVRVCAVNFGVGHPDSNRVVAGELDALLRAFDRFPQHIMGVHEYAVFSTVDERPFRVGRFLDLYKRCDVLRIRRPKVVATEAGRDVGGGENDGWRAVFNEAQYADFLGGYRDLYRAYNVDCCVFGYGRGANGRWQSFNVEGAGTVLNRLVQYNQETTGTDEMVRLYKEGVTYSLNLRREPMVSNPVNANVIGSVAPNEKVKLIRVRGGWAEVMKANGVQGHVSEQDGVVVIEAA